MHTCIPTQFQAGVLYLQQYVSIRKGSQFVPKIMFLESLPIVNLLRKQNIYGWTSITKNDNIVNCSLNILPVTPPLKIELGFRGTSLSLS